MNVPVLQRLATALALTVSVSVAEEPSVPVGLQVELLARVSGYDRNFTGRAGDKAHVLVVARPGNLDSKSVSREALRAFGATTQIAGVPADATAIDYVGATQLADEAKKRKAAIVYFAPGFSDEASKVASAFTGLDVLTVSSIASDVEKGIVLGFDLASGRPKLLVHLSQARRQNAAFKAEALKLMKVFE
jgi:hypothetical protein